ncbi:hypothetical protein K1T71_014065 [Dendrolimus kikuchii]|uniref:Uncharacterized protein n=1 Tax=Dendrolimus kikuchii TaxID=765133 RepID=A0ACC1CFA9_9NEOP|nr:hypothetical protein K1T71_014065 [Dendrolimus kikuchii]
MEDVYTIKVKTKPDTRNVYPSERRYSASTVSGLAWVHIALAATSFLLACLAIISPQKLAEQSSNEIADFNNESLVSDALSNSTSVESDNNYLLVLAPSLITLFGLAAGVTSILASVKWYVDHNITWLFIMSTLSTLVSFSSFVMIAVWFLTTEGETMADFYKDKEPFKDYVIVKHTDVVEKNSSHMIISLNKEENSKLFTKSVLSINILIAAFLELLWSILSMKISYKGMRNNYKDDNERRGNCISVVTTIKGNNAKKLPRNVKILPPKPDLIEHYPNRKIKRIFLAQDESGFYLKNHNNKNKNTETSSEFYKERMINFLNRCASLEGVSNPENPDRTPSVQSEALNPIPEITVETPDNRVTPVSWGDTPDHTVYNQNTLNLEKIFNFPKKQNDDKKHEDMKETE